jgi:non-lysosomal glucosylceramidase
VFEHNFKPSLEQHVNRQRTFALNDEAGLVLCSWPRDGQPRYPFIYSDEVWTGTEYQVAAHMIYEGLAEQGIRIVEAVRARHDGVRRNPWDEVECGHHYARSMSSWVVLLAITGFHCDMGRDTMRFEPVIEGSADEFRCAWFTGRGWGTYTQRKNAAGDWVPSVVVCGGDMRGIQVTTCGRTWQL